MVRFILLVVTLSLIDHRLVTHSFTHSLGAIDCLTNPSLQEFEFCLIEFPPYTNYRKLLLGQAFSNVKILDVYAYWLFIAILVDV